MSHEDELIQFCRQWDEAMISNDADLIAGFMSEDWVIVGTEGGVISRSDFLATIMNGDLAHHTMDTDWMRARVYGDTGVVISRGTSAGMYKNKPFSFYEWSSNTFVRANGAWSCVSTMLTPA